MTTGEFRQLFPNAPNPTAAAPSYGVVLTDSTQPGTPQTNTYAPRRSAPRGPRSSSTAPSEGKTHVTRADARKLYPQLKDASDADVDAAIRSAGYEPIP